MKRLSIWKDLRVEKHAIWMQLMMKLSFNESRASFPSRKIFNKTKNSPRFQTHIQKTILSKIQNRIIYFTSKLKTWGNYSLRDHTSITSQRGGWLGVANWWHLLTRWVGGLWKKYPTRKVFFAYIGFFFRLFSCFSFFMSIFSNLALFIWIFFVYLGGWVWGNADFDFLF